MEKSGKGYRVMGQQFGPNFDREWRRRMEAMKIKGRLARRGPGTAENEVQFCVFGCLDRDRSKREGEGERVVLVKAQAVLK